MILPNHLNKTIQKKNNNFHEMSFNYLSNSYASPMGIPMIPITENDLFLPSLQQQSSNTVENTIPPVQLDITSHQVGSTENERAVYGNIFENCVPEKPRQILKFFNIDSLIQSEKSQGFRCIGTEWCIL